MSASGCPYQQGYARKIRTDETLPCQGIEAIVGCSAFGLHSRSAVSWVSSVGRFGKAVWHQIIVGSEHRFRHYNIKDINVVTTSLTRFLENLKVKPQRTLYICHVTRDDLILGFLGAYQRHRKEGEKPFEAALIICGREGKYELCPEIRDILYGVEGAPMMLVGLSTHQAMTAINNFTRN
jgi:hypothetical protein